VNANPRHISVTRSANGAVTGALGGRLTFVTASQESMRKAARSSRSGRRSVTDAGDPVAESPESAGEQVVPRWVKAAATVIDAAPRVLRIRMKAREVAWSVRMIVAMLDAAPQILCARVEASKVSRSMYHR
jgi:hypothetical protein